MTITDELLRLMTAAVDGDLSEPEDRQLRSVLDASPKARATYAQLQADKDRLRDLPRLIPPADLAVRVMAGVSRIAPPRPVEPALASAPRRTRDWVPIAVAAGLLLCVAGSSFWYFTHENTSVARNPNQPPLATKDGASDPAWANWLPVDGARPPSAPMPQELNGAGVAKNDAPPQVPSPVIPDAIAQAPFPRDVRDPLHAFPVLPQLPPFNLVQARVPFLKSLTDFDREAVREELAAELARDPAFRIDLFTRDTARGVQVFQAAARASGLSIHADQTTMNLLKKGQVGAVAIFTESLTAGEIAALFHKLHGEDQKISPRLFDVVHASQVVRTDEIDLRSILGADPGLFKRLVPAPEKDPTRPIGAGTGDQLVKAIESGQGKPADKAAVLLTWSPAQARTSPAASNELKSYLGKRGARKPNAVPVIIVIRHGNG